MNPLELVHAAVRHDDLATRQFVKDAKRTEFDWSTAPAPTFSQAELRAVYAGLVELFTERSGQAAPAWTKDVPASPKPVFLASTEWLRMVEKAPNATLKSRNVFALGEYLDV